MKRISLVFLALLAMGVSAHAQIQGPGGCTALAPCTVITAPAPTTPVTVGGTNYTAGTPYTILTAGQCAAGCELQDISAQGFWINYSGTVSVPAPAVAGTSQYVPAGSIWSPTSGAITTAVSIMPVATGIIIGRHN